MTNRPAPVITPEEEWWQHRKLWAERVLMAIDPLWWQPVLRVLAEVPFTRSALNAEEEWLRRWGFALQSECTGRQRVCQEEAAMRAAFDHTCRSLKSKIKVRPPSAPLSSSFSRREHCARRTLGYDTELLPIVTTMHNAEVCRVPAIDLADPETVSHSACHTIRDAESVAAFSISGRQMTTFSVCPPAYSPRLPSTKVWFMNTSKAARHRPSSATQVRAPHDPYIRQAFSARQREVVNTAVYRSHGSPSVFVVNDGHRTIMSD